MAVDNSRATGGGTTKVPVEGKKSARLTGVSAEPRSASNRTLSSILTNRLLAAARVNNNTAARQLVINPPPRRDRAIDAIAIAKGKEGRERERERKRKKKDVIPSFPVISRCLWKRTPFFCFLGNSSVPLSEFSALLPSSSTSATRRLAEFRNPECSSIREADSSLECSPQPLIAPSRFSGVVRRGGPFTNARAAIS